MVKSVVKGLDIVIPIISFKEVSREDWRSMPRLIQTSFGKAPDLVVCSHLDQVSVVLDLFALSLTIVPEVHG